MITCYYTRDYLLEAYIPDCRIDENGLPETYVIVPFVDGLDSWKHCPYCGKRVLLSDKDNLEDIKDANTGDLKEELTLKENSLKSLRKDLEFQLTFEEDFDWEYFLDVVQEAMEASEDIDIIKKLIQGEYCEKISNTTDGGKS